MSQKVAWITGGSSGIGAATALQLAKEGWIVAITGTSLGKLDILCDKDPKFLKAYPGDVTKPKNIADLIDTIEQELGPIELAVLNAGIYNEDTAKTFTASSLKKHFEVNVFGVAHCLEPLLKKFLERKYGHIAITASFTGYRGLSGAISYSASKAALINLAESLAIELKDTGIQVQVICPGFIKTPMTDKNKFDMPLLMEVDKAAEELVEGLHSKRFEIIFPWMFCRFAKLLQLLPHRLYIWLIHKLANKFFAKSAQTKKKA